MRGRGRSCTACLARRHAARSIRPLAGVAGSGRRKFGGEELGRTLVGSGGGRWRPETTTPPDARARTERRLRAHRMKPPVSDAFSSSSSSSFPCRVRTSARETIGEKKCRCVRPCCFLCVSATTYVATGKRTELLFYLGRPWDTIQGLVVRYMQY